MAVPGEWGQLFDFLTSSFVFIDIRGLFHHFWSRRVEKPSHGTGILPVLGHGQDGRAT
jgi:hypothetical protein